MKLPWKWCSSEFTLFLIQDEGYLNISVNKEMTENGDEIHVVKRRKNNYFVPSRKGST